MREIRLCDSGELDLTKELCFNNNIGIEYQTFSDPDPKEEELEEQLKKHQLITDTIPGKKSLHAPFQDLNLGSKTPGIRRVTMDFFEYAYRIAKELGCTEVIVHNGYIPGNSSIDKWSARAIEFWKEFFKDKDDSITMCIENQRELDCEVFIKEIDGLGDPRLKCCLDVGHANAHSNQKVEEWIETLGDRIGYFHLHNNHGKKGNPEKDDEHLGLTDGNIDMKRVFEQIEAYCKDAVVSVETKPEYLLESVRWLKEQGYLNSQEMKHL